MPASVHGPSEPCRQPGRACPRFRIRSRRSASTAARAGPRPTALRHASDQCRRGRRAMWPGHAEAAPIPDPLCRRGGWRARCNNECPHAKLCVCCADVHKHPGSEASERADTHNLCRSPGGPGTQGRPSPLTLAPSSPTQCARISPDAPRPPAAQILRTRASRQSLLRFAPRSVPAAGLPGLCARCGPVAGTRRSRRLGFPVVKWVCIRAKS